MRILSSRLPRKLAVVFAMATAATVSPIGLFSPSDAFAQDATPPKKKKKPKPAETEAAPAPAAPVEAAPAPAAAAPAEAAATPTPEGMPASAEAKPVEGDDFESTDVTEKAGKTYYFIGLRYRHTIVPKFLINAFVSEGATFHSNSIGIEADIRKDGFSLIPAISYAEYGSDNVLFLQKNADAKDPGNWSVVNSSLKAIYFTADLLWSAKISKNVDFEYGGGAGIGVIFGDLSNNWVYETTPNGPLVSSDGTRHFTPCQVTDTQPGCNTINHQNASVRKVGGYTEPSWVNGGSKPNIFPHIALPELGIRIKPVKQFEARVMLGFSLTGFFFGINGAYGLEKREVEKPANDTK